MSRTLYNHDDYDLPYLLPPEWHEQAACRGFPTEWWVSTRGKNYEVAKAKSICEQCTVSEECLEYALADTKLEGIWAGTSPNERDKIRRERRQAQQH